ncbi:hypothetical protein Dimus_036893 [Dionaea muscipula]
MELIEKTRDGKILFKKRLLVHVDLCQRILCKDDGDSLEEKGYCEVEVRGVDLEFDNEKLATILGVHGKNGICEYIEEVWEESKYTKPLEITGRFANDATDHEGRKSAIDRDETFSKVYSFYGSGENRRRDDDEATQEEEAEGDDEGNKDDFGGRR